MWSILAYLVFCPAYNPTNCEWLIKAGHFAGGGFSSTRSCGTVLSAGDTPYGPGKIIIKCRHPRQGEAFVYPTEIRND